MTQIKGHTTTLTSGKLHHISSIKNINDPEEIKKTFENLLKVHLEKHNYMPDIVHVWEECPEFDSLGIKIKRTRTMLIGDFWFIIPAEK